jgi:2'-5' RNA ligase
MIDFAKLEFDDATEGLMFEFCKTHRLGLADLDDRSSLSPGDFKFHVTVMYSKVTNPMFPEGARDFVPHVLRPERFDMFGADNDILVLRLYRDDVLAALFDHYRETYGHVSEFMPYRPHVTIRGSGAGVKDRLQQLPLPDFDLRALRLVHKVKAS